MSSQRVNREFEVFMRTMTEAQETVKENIECELRALIRVTVNSCATMYGFSAEEALKRLDTDGRIAEVPVKVPTKQKKEDNKILKEADKVEKLKVKEAVKAEKLSVKTEEDRRKDEKQCANFWKRQQKNENDKVKEAGKTEKLREKTEKNSESSERSAMKGEEVLSKAAEKLAKKTEKLRLKKTEKTEKTEKTKKPKKEKKENTVFIIEESDDEESLASTVLMTDSEDEEPHVLFQNIPLINEINSICDVKKFKNWKQLSAGVKLARQILDI
jgi:hypothetical protein